MGLDQTYLSLLISSLLILLSALECLLKITLKVAMSGWWHRCRTGERWQYRSSSSESERRMEHAESKMIRNQEKVWLHGWTTMLNIVEVRIPNFWSVCPYLSCRFFVQVTLGGFHGIPWAPLNCQQFSQRWDARRGRSTQQGCSSVSGELEQ